MASNMMPPPPTTTSLIADAKSALIIFCQRAKQKQPTFTVATSGPPHNRQFAATVTLEDGQFITGEPAMNKKAAEKDAAAKMLALVNGSTYNTATANAVSARTGTITGKRKASEAVDENLGSSVRALKKKMTKRARRGLTDVSFRLIDGFHTSLLENVLIPVGTEAEAVYMAALCTRHAVASQGRRSLILCESEALRTSLEKAFREIMPLSIASFSPQSNQDLQDVEKNVLLSSVHTIQSKEIDPKFLSDWNSLSYIGNRDALTSAEMVKWLQKADIYVESALKTKNLVLLVAPEVQHNHEELDRIAGAFHCHVVSSELVTLTTKAGQPQDGQMGPAKPKLNSEDIRNQLVQFLQSKSTQTYAFPESLSAFERFLVHRAARDFNLISSSNGEGFLRHVTVSIPPNYELPEALQPKKATLPQTDGGMTSDDESDNEFDVEIFRSLGVGAASTVGVKHVALAFPQILNEDFRPLTQSTDEVLEVEGHLYVLRMASADDTRHNGNFGLFNARELPSNMEPVHIFTKYSGHLIVSVVYQGPVKLSKAELSKVQEFNVFLFAETISTKKNSFDFTFTRSDKRFLVLPLRPAELTVPQTSHSIDWETIERCKTYASAESRLPLAVRTPEQRDQALCAVVTTINSAVKRPHYILSVEHTMSPLSPFPDQSEEIKTFSDYFKTKYGFDLDPDQPLVRAKFAAMKPQNFHFIDKEFQVNEGYGEVILVPELCRVHPLTSQMFLHAGYLPSIGHLLERQLLVAQFKDKVLGSLSTPLTAQALTCPSADPGHNYDRLEFLGDAVLKYSLTLEIFIRHFNSNEGKMSRTRLRYISNKHLCNVSTKKELYKYLNVLPNAPKLWSPPGCPIPLVGISDKTKADVVESLLGAAYMEKGLDAARELANTLEIVNLPLIKDPESTVRSLSKDIKATAPQETLERIQRIIGYTFQNPNLLGAAITHRSYRSLYPRTKDYETLEFLGDAILDFVVTSYLYEKYPESAAGMLSDMRAATVNNDVFAHRVVALQLHRVLQYNSLSLQRDILAFKQAWNAMDRNYAGFYDALEVDPPKALGDMLEAIVGAVMIDGGIEAARQVIFGLLKAYIDAHVTPTTIQKHPIRELQELAAGTDPRLVLGFRKVGHELDESKELYEIEGLLNGVHLAFGRATSVSKAMVLTCKAGVAAFAQVLQTLNLPPLPQK